MQSFEPILFKSRLEISETSNSLSNFDFHNVLSIHVMGSVGYQKAFSTGHSLKTVQKFQLVQNSTTHFSPMLKAAFLIFSAFPYTVQGASLNP